MADGGIALAIMCKAPVAGESKTRLCPPLSPEEAANLSRCFIADVAATVAAVARDVGGQGYAVITPVGSEGAFADLLPDGVRILTQRGPDLSVRLIHATRDLLVAGHTGVCLINADGPTLPPELLALAMAVLREPGEGIALVPAIDGGYALIGFNREHPSLFTDVAWSTSRVLAQTLVRAARLRLPVSLLPTWYDVDDIAGLELLGCELFGAVEFVLNGQGVKGAPAPRTRAFLAELPAGGDGIPGIAPPTPSPNAPRRPPTPRWRPALMVRRASD